MILAFILTAFLIALFVYVIYSFVVSKTDPITGFTNVVNHTVEAFKGA